MMKVKAKRRKLNVGLLREVQQAILAEPKRFDMRRWFGMNRCGTTACIAGFAISMAKPGQLPAMLRRKYNIDRLDAPAVARKLFGLSKPLAEKLFIEERWPLRFQLMHPPLSKGAAQAASDYIDYFIKKHGPRSRKVK